MNFRYILLTAMAVLFNLVCGHAQNIDDFEVTDLTLEVRDGYINVDMDIDLTDVNFWRAGLASIAEQIDEFCRLVNE